MNAQPVGYRASKFVPRHLILYFVLALGLNWILGALIFFRVYTPPETDSLLQPTLASILFIILMVLSNISPTLAGFVTAGITEGKAGVKELWGRFWTRHLSLKWLLAAVLLIPAIRLVANLIYRGLDGQDYPWFHYGDVMAGVTAFLSAFVTTGMTEEFGWRGYALPRLQAKWNALTSTLILGVLWASWHVTGLVTPGAALYGRDLVEFVPWVIITAIYQTWIFNNTNGNVLACVVLHAMINTAVVWCCPDPGLRLIWLYGSYFLAAVLIVVIFGPKNMVRQQTEEGT